MITLAVLAALFTGVFLFLQHPKFGRRPSGKRQQKIMLSPHFRDGSFQNLSPTPYLTEGASMFRVLKEFIFTTHPRKRPAETIPSVKTDLHRLDAAQNVLIWFGHSSYFIQLDGKKFLVDPVLSGAASPIAFTTRSFPGTDIYDVSEIPPIDYLLITHDHWDHLDYKTILKLDFKKVVCAMGTGEHFEKWHIPSHKIIERDWNEEVVLEPGFVINTVPGRHFSGRTLVRNKALWTSFVLQTPSKRIFIGGDSGYDTHFATAGEKFNGFDLAILENGQYDKNWKYIHMQPEEVWQASKDLKAKKLLAVHSSKFSLANHPWDEPLRRISALAEEGNIILLTPMIGEPVDLNAEISPFSKWWETIS